jgi:hypothetical protein
MYPNLGYLISNIVRDPENFLPSVWNWVGEKSKIFHALWKPSNLSMCENLDL